jgi:LPXTG-motif cell wall-anchored protein
MLKLIEGLPTTGQSILWIVIIGAVVLMAGLLLFLRTRKGTTNS